MPLSNLKSSLNQYDIIVVGSGAAGLYSALCLPSHLQVAIVTKDAIKTGSSSWAQGGIAAAIAPDDSPQFHLEDTLKAGAGLCDREVVDFLVKNAATSIESLVKMGVGFDRHGQNLALTKEAAHSHSRILHSADTTGRAIVDTLIAKVQERSNIEILSQAFVLSLWLDGNRTQGVSILYNNQIQWVRAKAVILATGGSGQIYAKTTNPKVSTGDGVALAWRVGAVVRDLEFFQFHPTALAKKGAPHFLISEAVRGEGAHLIDNNGYRFAFDYHSDGELAPRDVVSRGIFYHLEKTSTDLSNANVYLDLRPINAERINYRFPNIIKVCQNHGIDVFEQPIPVAPAAHYWMGGIATDLRGQTSISGLYAIGETASTGVHGANRLASNSLLECFVFAAQLSQIKVESNGSVNRSFLSISESKTWDDEIEEILAIRSRLPQLMWHSAGISRSQELLENAIAQVSFWREKLTTSDLGQYLRKLTPNETITFQSPSAEKQLKIAAETLNLVEVSYLILKSAAWRTESRGGHYRRDYPQPSSNWQFHTLIQGDNIWKSSPLTSSLLNSVA
ncbi:MAG: L-aspartate oxidase [Moorea sp. SIO2B7]|nr:L-aspartate oxidase [Moorena sp. SIO2B7]